MKYAPFLLALSLSACGQQADNASTATPVAAPETNAATETVAASPGDGPPPSFAQCATCHSVKPGETGLGPNLHGIIGKKSASIEKFFYSTAMKNANLTWDEATLDRYIEKPRELVPGTRMAYAGQADKAKRDEIIAWLKKNS